MLLFKRPPLLVCVSFVLVFLLSCNSDKIYSRGALFDLVIRPYPAYKNLLVNQRCIKYEKGICIETDILAFDLKKEADRTQLIRSKFLCNVGGQRFGICSNSAGLCQQSRIGKRPCLFCERSIVTIKKLDIEKDFQYILDSNTLCAAQDSFVGKRLFAL